MEIVELEGDMGGEDCTCTAGAGGGAGRRNRLGIEQGSSCAGDEAI